MESLTEKLLTAEEASELTGPSSGYPSEAGVATPHTQLQGVGAVRFKRSDVEKLVIERPAKKEIKENEPS